MSVEALYRAGSVAVAVAIVAAPHWRSVLSVVTALWSVAQSHVSGLSRFAAAGVILAVAWGKIPLPQLPATPLAPAIVVPEPDADMRRLVEPVRAAIGSLTPADRAVWAATWSKAALVVDAEGKTSVSVFADTATLRAFTLISLDVAWRRIAGHEPGTVDGLRDAVETAMRTAIGLDEVPATPAVREQYSKVARAIAWAGTGG